jgi:diguanylate cyclase (GGDEF)-like protein
MDRKTVNILLVEDNPGDIRLIQEFLAEAEVDKALLITAGTLSRGMELLDCSAIDAVLLDLGLPDSQGLDTLHAVREKCGNVPIVVLSGLRDEETAISAVQNGAQDYLVKGRVDGNLLWRSLCYAVERKRLEHLLVMQATHDMLTGLPNRTLLIDRASVAIARAERNKKKLGLMLLDLDRFKTVNDTLGHSVGDGLLKAVSSRLVEIVRTSDTIARLGGDEFTILCPEITGYPEASDMARRVLDCFTAPFVFDSRELSISTSIGIAIYPEDGTSFETILKNADIAMYRVKDAGRNNYSFFSQLRPDGII